MAEAPSRLTIPAQALESWPAERLFDVRWAATVAERALRNLQDECERRGRRRVFDALSGSLYKALTGALGFGPAAIGWLGAVVAAVWALLALALGRGFQRRAGAVRAN